MSGLPPLRCRALSALLLFFICAVANAERLPSAASAPGAPSDPNQAVLFQRMSASMEALAARTDGVLSVAITDLRDGTRYTLHADHVFAVASTIKLAILFELFRQADQGLLSLSDLQPVPTTALIEGSPILGGLLRVDTGATTTAPRPFSLRELAVYMIVTSDNTATNALIDRLGFAAINDLCQRQGLGKTRLRRRMLDTAAVRRGDENTATASELAALIAQISRFPWRRDTSQRELLAILSLPKESFFARGLPSEQPMASKLGSLDGVRAEVAIVPLPERPFVLSAIVAYARDGAAAERTLADVATAAHSYFSALGEHTTHGRKRPSP